MEKFFRTRKISCKIVEIFKKKFGVACVYSAETVMYPQADGTVCEAKEDSEGSRKLDCESGLGAATQVTGAFGFAAAGFVVDSLIK